MFFGFGLFEIVFIFLVFGLFLLWPWALFECLTRESRLGNTRIVWTLVILLAPVVGPILYRVVRRPQRIHELGR